MNDKDCKRCGLPIDPKRVIVEFDDGTRAHETPEACIRLLREACKESEKCLGERVVAEGKLLNERRICHGYVGALVAAAEAAINEIDGADGVPAGPRRAATLLYSASKALTSAWFDGEEKP